MQGRDYLRALTRTPVPKELAFPLAEYQARVERVRARMAAAGLDLLLVTHPPNLCYLTGYSTFAVGRHACLLLPARGELVLQVSAMAIPAAVLTGWVEHVEPYDWNEVDRIPERIAALVRAQGLERARTGLELARLPAQTHADVRRHLPDATFEDASGLVMGVRLIKSAAELDCMRRAARMTLAGVEASYQAIAPGRTDNDVARAGYDAMVAAGSEFLSVDPIVTAGHRSGWAHTSFKRNALKVGDVVFLEYGGCYQRYTAPLMRTAVIGEPSAAVRRAADAARATVELVIENVRPGRSADDVARAARRGHAAVGDEIYFQEVYGEATGLTFPPTLVESPTVIAAGADYRLEPGMTFHLPIAMRRPGEFCVGLSETIAVTETGCEVLTEKTRDLVVIHP